MNSFRLSGPCLVVVFAIGMTQLIPFPVTAVGNAPKKLKEIELRPGQLSPDRTLGLDELSWSGEIDINATLKLPAKMNVSSKGNGALDISNLSVKVYDGHPDPGEYENTMLRTVFADIDDDGYRDLIVSGRVLYFDEKSDDIDHTENVVFLFHFDPQTKTFRETYRGATFSILLPR